MLISRLAERSGVPATTLRFYESAGLLRADRAGDVAAPAADEQRCCPFLGFRLHLDGPVLHLRVRAPAEGAALLAQLFGPAA
ncbi:MerR family DNA-binding transcriptional regulator [Streptomyces sp. NPDC087218]|uniref:MerR family DNA-binding transcriptional regulator n=1 Tax=Streptomyces sp. NPDC087218 TaxID=3365769 RepID=UPI00381E23CC